MEVIHGAKQSLGKDIVESGDSICRSKLRNNKVRKRKSSSFLWLELSL